MGRREEPLLENDGRGVLAPWTEFGKKENDPDLVTFFSEGREKEKENLKSHR